MFKLFLNRIYILKKGSYSYKDASVINYSLFTNYVTAN